jgi:hypothetical protein
MSQIVFETNSKTAQNFIYTITLFTCKGLKILNKVDREDLQFSIENFIYSFIFILYYIYRSAVSYMLCIV